MKIDNLIIIGKNRYLEKNPFKEILKIKKKLNIIVLASEADLKKKNSNNINFKEFLVKEKIQFFLVRNKSEIYKILKKIFNKNKNSIMLSVGSSFIFDKKIINYFKNRLFNYHIGYLPFERGGAASTWALMTGRKQTALTIHKISSGIDKGDIVIQNKFVLNKNDNLKNYYKKIREKEKDFFKKFFKILSKKLRYLKQKNNLSIYMPRLETKVHSFINWSWGAQDIVNFINSFDYPYPGARTFLDKKLVILKHAKIEKKLSNFHPFQSGIIFRIENEVCYVACKNYAINVKIFTKNNNKKIIKKVLGKRLYTPSKYLELALTSKSIHLPEGIKIK